jgi:hypothetical protein
MGDIADQIDTIRVQREAIQMPTKDGTGSATSIAQHGFHAKHFDKLEPEKQSWRDLTRVQVSEVFSIKDPAELQAALIRLMAVCADWHEDIERRRNDG